MLSYSFLAKTRAGDCCSFRRLSSNICCALLRPLLSARYHANMPTSKLQPVVVHTTGNVIDIAACPICWEHFTYRGVIRESAKGIMVDRFAFHLKQRHTCEEVRQATARTAKRDVG